MLTKIQGFIISVMFISNCLAQNNLKGFVFNLGNSNVLVGSTINNTIQKHFTLSNNFGFFSCNVKIGDTIIISHVGFKSINYIVKTIDTNAINFWLEPMLIELKEAKISANNLYKNPKMAAQLLKTDSLLNNYSKFKEWPRGIELNTGSTFGCTGCINALWMKYSKRGKEINKVTYLANQYQNLLKADEKWQQLLKILAKQNIPLKKLELCKPNTNKLIELNTYDLLIVLNNCLNNN